MGSWRRYVLALAVLAALTVGGRAGAEDSDEMVRAVETATSEASRDIEALWGDASRLPENKVWVGYDVGLRSRVVVDYEIGALVVESIDFRLSDADLRAILDHTLKASSRDLDAMDVVAERVRGATKRWAATRKSLRPLEPRELAGLMDPGQAKAMAFSETQRVGGHVLRRLTVAVGEAFKSRAAERFRPQVAAQARRRHLAPSLIASVIKNESAFNPRARSHVPAFGLMQLVPRTGGRDALTFKLNRPAQPTPDYLYNPQNNIELGAIYFHILGTRYLKGITDGRSRLYCMIAAYNTGAGNVARGITGGGSLKALARRINAMGADQVYGTLLKRLPHAETRDYLKKVVRDMKAFAAWDGDGGAGASSARPDRPVSRPAPPSVRPPDPPTVRRPDPPTTRRRVSPPARPPAPDSWQPFN